MKIKVNKLNVVHMCEALNSMRINRSLLTKEINEYPLEIEFCQHYFFIENLNQFNKLINDLEEKIFSYQT
jgi:hypothetical protein